MIEEFVNVIGVEGRSLNITKATKTNIIENIIAINRASFSEIVFVATDDDGNVGTFGDDLVDPDASQYADREILLTKLQSRNL